MLIYFFFFIVKNRMIFIRKVLHKDHGGLSTYFKHGVKIKIKIQKQKGPHCTIEKAGRLVDTTTQIPKSHHNTHKHKEEIQKLKDKWDIQTASGVLTQFVAPQ